MLREDFDDRAFPPLAARVSAREEDHEGLPSGALGHDSEEVSGARPRAPQPKQGRAR